VRHWLARHDLKSSLCHLAIGGAVIRYITGIRAAAQAGNVSAGVVGIMLAADRACWSALFGANSPKYTPLPFL
jgi:hypothetical protein